MAALPIPDSEATAIAIAAAGAASSGEVASCYVYVLDFLHV
jgi:hypothetical protein